MPQVIKDHDPVLAQRVWKVSMNSATVASKSSPGVLSKVYYYPSFHWFLKIEEKVNKGF